MANDDPSIPAWQRAIVESAPTSTEAPDTSRPTSSAAKHDLASAEASAEQMPDLAGREVNEMAQIPAREEAAKFLDHPGTKNATAEDKIRFLEVKGVRSEDIEALIPEAKNLYAAVCFVLWNNIALNC